MILFQLPAIGGLGQRVVQIAHPRRTRLNCMIGDFTCSSNRGASVKSHRDRVCVFFKNDLPSARGVEIKGIS
jgi:hypothetical protein